MLLKDEKTLAPGCQLLALCAVGATCIMQPRPVGGVLAGGQLVPRSIETDLHDFTPTLTLHRQGGEDKSLPPSTGEG